jgi:hypothetical protein
MSGDAIDRPDPSGSLRASDAERESVVHHLNRAAEEGRLTLAEFSERAASAYAAITRADLEPLLADLPAASPPGSGAAAVAPVTGAALSPASGAASPDRAPLQQVPIGAIKRGGRWRLERVTRMKVALGPVKLDLSGAEIAGPEVDLHVRTSVGSVKVWVPVGVRVVVDGATTVGTRTIEEDSATGPGPLVRLHIDTWVGTVKVFRV